VSLLSIEIMLALIGVDILFGVIMALKEGTFTFQKLADYLTTDGVPFIVYLALGFPAMVVPGFATILIGVAATFIAALTAMVLDKASKLLGFQIPKALS
jgi:hypothetical protein